MRRILSEKNIVVILFVLVFITFCLAQEDSKKMERLYTGSGAGSVAQRIEQTPVETREASSALPAEKQ